MSLVRRAGSSSRLAVAAVLAAALLAVVLLTNATPVSAVASDDFSIGCVTPLTASAPASATGLPVSVNATCSVVGGSHWVTSTAITLSCPNNGAGSTALVRCVSFSPPTVKTITGQDVTTVKLDIYFGATNPTIVMVRATAGAFTHDTPIEVVVGPGKEILLGCSLSSFSRLPTATNVTVSTPVIQPTSRGCELSGVNLRSQATAALTCVIPPQSAAAVLGCSFAPASGVLPFASVLTVSLAPTASTAPGTYPFQVRALSDEAEELEAMAFTQAPSCSLDIDPGTTDASLGGAPKPDGLAASAETCGVGAPGTTAYLDFPAMLASPGVLDIYVQLDWMRGPTTVTDPVLRENYYKLKQDALCMVQESFKRKGVNLRIDQGPDSLLDCVTGLTWGTLSRAKAVNFVTTLGTIDTATSMYNWAAFDAIKLANFTATGRAPYFRYALAARNYDGAGGSSGISRGSPSSDFMVTLGLRNDPVTLRGGGSVRDQAGTFMHELGHGLGLNHGGVDDPATTAVNEGTIGYKPNYLSVMNYLFQFGGLIKSGAEGYFDYSGAALPTLNEPTLNEAAPGIPAGYGTRFFCAGVGFVPVYADTIGSINWNCDAMNPNGGTVVADINADGLCVKSATNAALGTLASATDVTVGNTQVRAGANRKCDTTVKKGTNDIQVKPTTYTEPGPLTGTNDWAILNFRTGLVGAAAGAGALEDNTFINPNDPELMPEAADKIVPVGKEPPGGTARLKVNTIALTPPGFPDASNTNVFRIGAPIALTASFTDSAPGPFSGPHLCWVNWDDGDGPRAGTMLDTTGGAGTCTASRPAGGWGAYVVSVMVYNINTAEIGTKTVTIVVYDPNGGTFVVGDRAVYSQSGALIPNAPVTFWGSQWPTLNPTTMSGSDQSFTGFAPLAIPSCAANWSFRSSGGNSTAPPPTVPPLIAVLVTGGITKTNSGIVTGSTRSIVLVRTNPGFGSGAGNTGTGTVVGVFKACAP